MLLLLFGSLPSIIKMCHDSVIGQAEDRIKSDGVWDLYKLEYKLNCVHSTCSIILKTVIYRRLAFMHCQVRLCIFYFKKKIYFLIKIVILSVLLYLVYCILAKSMYSSTIKLHVQNSSHWHSYRNILGQYPNS